MSSIEAGGGESPAPAATNPFQRMAGVLYAPAETLKGIVSKPDILVPLIIVVAIAVAVSFVTSGHLNMESSLRAQFSEQGLTEAQAERAIEIATKFQKLAPIITMVTVPLILLVIAGVPLIVFKLFGAEGTFREFFSVVLYSWIPLLIKYVVTAIVALTKGEMTIQEMATLVKSNPAFLTDMNANGPFFALLGHIDLFEIWAVVLLVIGFAFAARVSTKKSAAVVLTLWAIVILGGAGIAALQGMAGGRH